MPGDVVADNGGYECDVCDDGDDDDDSGSEAVSVCCAGS